MVLSRPQVIFFFPFKHPFLLAPIFPPALLFPRMTSALGSVYKVPELYVKSWHYNVRTFDIHRTHLHLQASSRESHKAQWAALEKWVFISLACFTGEETGTEVFPNMMESFVQGQLVSQKQKEENNPGVTDSSHVVVHQSTLFQNK